jgi:hypothetical protein
MQRVTLSRLGFSAYLKLCVAVSIALGFSLGTVAFVLSLVGVDVRVKLFVTELTGVVAGIAAIPLAPILFSGLGFAAGIISYLPFRWLLELLGGIALAADCDVT